MCTLWSVRVVFVYVCVCVCVRFRALINGHSPRTETSLSAAVMSTIMAFAMATLIHVHWRFFDTRRWNDETYAIMWKKKNETWAVLAGQLDAHELHSNMLMNSMGQREDGKLRNNKNYFQILLLTNEFILRKIIIAAIGWITVTLEWWGNGSQIGCHPAENFKWIMDVMDAVDVVNPFHAKSTRNDIS